MSPHPCSGCYLLETSGGVCPAARSAYGLETPAYVLARAQALHAAIHEDANQIRTLRDLVALDAAGRLAAQRGSNPVRALRAAPELQTRRTTEKEEINVDASSTD